MNAFTRILTVGTITSMALGTAMANEPTNTAKTVALGYGQTIGGADGVSFRYGFGGGLAFEGILGFSDKSLTQTNNKTNGTTSNHLDVGLAFDYKPKALRGDKVALSLTGDFNYMKWGEGTIASGTETEHSYNDIAVGVGMRTEYFPASWMSVNTRFGLSISPNGAGQQDGDPSSGGSTDYGGMDVETNGDFFGGAGVSFWFR